jgi:pimeloyl-ACP methyl ester carboxylesterase
MPQVVGNGITIEYERRGRGEPLLLVMGLGGQLTDWPDGFVDTLVEAGFEVIVFDNRDIGLSTESDWEPPTQLRAFAGSMVRRPPESGYTISDMAADADSLLDALEIEAAHVVGMSMGGMIAQQMAIDSARRVRSLTSIMSNTGDRKNGRVAKRTLAKLARLPRPTRETAAQRSVESFELFSGPHFDPVEHLERSKESVDRSFRPTGTLRQTTAILASPDRTEGLGRVTAPTLVVHGLVDTLVLPSGGIATARAVPGSRLVMYPDMGHDLPRPRWQEMVDAIRRNADRTEGSVAPAPAASAAG